MTIIIWDIKAREFLRSLPKEVANRIFRKIDSEISKNVTRYLERLVGIEIYKIRIGEYRLFADYNNDTLIIRAIRHRRDAYK